VEYRRAILTVLGEEGRELHWTVIQDLALRRGYLDPFTQPDIRKNLLAALARATKDGDVRKTATGVYELPPADATEEDRPMQARPDSFPRQSARTRRFTLGAPRSFAVADDGSRVAFLRSGSGEDPVHALWVVDVEEGRERLVVDPGELLGGGEEHLSPEERARRERARETGGGVVAFATDRAFRTAAFALDRRLFVADLVDGGAREVAVQGPVFDPRPDPTGTWVAYVADGALRVAAIDGGEDLVVTEEPDPAVIWGMAEFVAAEEMDRLRGYWWSPEGDALLAARVDENPVMVWHIADPANPASEPQAVRYPAAGTANADVSLHVVRLDGSRTEVRWDRAAFPYVVAAGWAAGRSPTILVQSRDQRRWQVLAVDAASGETTVLRQDEDHVWLEIVQGVPAWTDRGELVMVGDVDGARRLTVDGRAVTPDGVHVKRVVHVADRVLFTAWSDEPTETHVWRRSSSGSLDRLTDEPGVHDAVAGGGDVMVLLSASLDRSGTRAVVRRGSTDAATIASFAETPLVEPRVRPTRLGRSELPSAVLFPGGVPPDHPLPVLLDPYGGPHFQKVVSARSAFLESQWWADQGFAVLVADGRGTPGRGPEWEKSVPFDLATPALEDQVEALTAAAEAHPGAFDLSRVAIRGWSFGGYLSALAVLRRPDVFHAAVVGAPVTDWRLYDTHYTEHYLGHPDDHPEAYRRSSLLDDAPGLVRPVLLIHGLADDNVVVAHTLRFSRALLEAGRAHRVIPLSGITHMAGHEVVAENLLLLQLAFLREALGVAPQPAAEATTQRA
jgi:dipeptidyl-peptidase 4